MASPFPERRSPSRRFLPPDPRSAEPYRFTPQLALRIGVLAGLVLIVFAMRGFQQAWNVEVERYEDGSSNEEIVAARA